MKRRFALALAALLAVLPLPRQPTIAAIAPIAIPANSQTLISSGMAFVNTSASTQNAGVPTQVFGLVFKDGDMCGGAAPIFKDHGSGAVQPYSYGLLTYWKSGCVMRGSFMLLPTVSVAGNATWHLDIYNGGSWPTQGSGTAGANRTLAEAYANSLSASVTAAPITNAGFTGTLGAWLTNDSNNYKVVKWLDGQAGTAWRISVNMAATQGGTAEGRMVFDHYVVGLSNASGNLAAFRWLGAARQPKYNGTTGALRAFASMTWSENGNSHNNTWPFAAQTFTVTSGTPTITNASTYYTGAGFGGGDNGNVVPGYFTDTAGLPTSTPQIDTASVWYVQQYTNPNIRGALARPNATGSDVISFSGSSSGTITFNPIMINLPFSRLWFATTDAKYNFFQGAGSQSAETTLRNTIDQTYWQKSGVIPPYSTSIIGSVADTTFTYNWHPMSIGGFFQTQQEVGDHPDLGPIPDDHARDFYVQSVLTEKLARIEGLSAGLTGFDFKDATTDTIVNVSANSYTGLPASVSSTLVWGTSGQAGFTALANFNALGFSQIDTSHRPNYCPWPWLRFGELQYLDGLVETGIGGVTGSDLTNRNITSLGTNGSYTATGVISNFYSNGELRTMAWAEVGLQWAAFLYPWNPTNPTALAFDGTQTGKYLNDLADLQCQVAVDMMNASNNVYGAATSYLVTTRSFWTMAGSFNGASGVYLSNMPTVWMCFKIFAYDIAAQRGNANALTFINLFANRDNYTATKYGGAAGAGDHRGAWLLYTEADENVGYAETNQNKLNYAAQLITTDNGYNIGSGQQNFSANTANLSWSAATPPATAFSVATSAFGGNGYTPQNGDLLTMYAAHAVFQGSISGTTMTAAAPSNYLGLISPGDWVQGAAPNTIVQAYGTGGTTGTGGAGTYAVSISQTVATQSLAAVQTQTSTPNALTNPINIPVNQPAAITGLTTSGANTVWNLEAVGGLALQTFDSATLPAGIGVGVGFLPQAVPAASTGKYVGPSPVYPVEHKFAWDWCNAVGGSNFSGLQDDVNTRLSVSGYNYATGAAGVRYASQGTFGP